MDRKEYIRNYQREWIRKRREVWFKANGPCAQCASWDDLELDHKDPMTKVSHAVWSWRQERRDEELAKCQVLCKRCHRVKTTKHISRTPDHGTVARYSHRTLRCRCRPCTDAAVGYVMERRKRLGHR